MKYFLTALCAAGVVIVALSYYVFRKACRRESELPWEDVQALKKTSWAPMAEIIGETAQFLRENQAKDLFTRSYDGLRLHGLWLPAEHPIGSLLLFHGYRSSYLSDFSMVISFYHRLGLNLLLAEQRSHGKSEGRYITFGVREHRDVLTWVEYHNAHLGQFPIFLGGMSMGATTVLMAAGETLPNNVRGVVADCGFSSPGEIIAHVMKKSHLPKYPLLPVVGMFTRLIAGFGLEECSTVTAMKNCRIPVLIIHGTGDHFVPCEMSQRAFAACGGEKQIILVSNAGHGQSYLEDQPRCQSALENFFAAHLEK